MEAQNPAANASPAPVESTTSTAGATIRRLPTWQPAGPNFTTTCVATPSRLTASVSASAAVAKSMSGRSLSMSETIRAGPYSSSPATEDRSIESMPPRERTSSTALRAACASGSRNSE